MSTFTQAIAESICERIAEGESLRRICRDEGMPTPRTVFRWLEANQNFRAQYARAREIQQDTYIDETIDLANEATPENWAVKRLQISTRQWMAAKLAPKKYGERQSIEMDVRHSLSELSDEELNAEIARLAAKAGEAAAPEQVKH